GRQFFLDGVGPEHVGLAAQEPEISYQNMSIDQRLIRRKVLGGNRDCIGTSDRELLDRDPPTVPAEILERRLAGLNRPAVLVHNLDAKRGRLRHLWRDAHQAGALVLRVALEDLEILLQRSDFWGGC